MDTRGETIRADYLVLGSGIAGLRAALGLARHGRVLEGLLFGARAAEAVVADGPLPPADPHEGAPGGGGERWDPEELRRQLRRRAWRHLGLERDAAGLGDLPAFLEPLRKSAAGGPRDRAEAEARNLADVAWAMAASALFREESRGAHFRTDFPQTDDARFRGETLHERGARLADVEAPVPASARC